MGRGGYGLSGGGLSCEARIGKASGRRTDHIWLKRNLERHRDAAIEDEEGQSHVPSRAEARVGLEHWEAHGGTAPLERLELLRDHLIRQRSGRRSVSTERVTIGGNQVTISGGLHTCSSMNSLRRDA